MRLPLIMGFAFKNLFVYSQFLLHIFQLSLIYHFRAVVYLHYIGVLTIYVRKSLVVVTAYFSHTIEILFILCNEKLYRIVIEISIMYVFKQIDIILVSFQHTLHKTEFQLSLEVMFIEIKHYCICPH